MEIEMTALAMRADISADMKYLLGFIGDYTNDTGEGCFASNERLAYQSGFTVREVQRLRKEMEKLGYIEMVGRHPEYGTNIINILVKNIPMLPPFEVWCENLDKSPLDSQKEGGDTLPGEWATFSAIGDESFPPNLSYDRQDKPSDTQPAKTGLFQDIDEPLPRDQRPSRDHDMENVSVEDEDDPKAHLRPRTALERLIVSQTGYGKAKYITPPTRRLLNQTVLASQGKAREQEYPSPEELYKTEKRFHDYVLWRVQQFKAAAGSVPPTRAQLVKFIRQYGHYKIGWFDYRDLSPMESDLEKGGKNRKHEASSSGRTHFPWT